MTENTAKVTVTEVENEVSEAEKQRLAKKHAKEQEREKKYWNSMVTRKETLTLVNELMGEFNQRLQILMVQNRTLLEILDKKGLATEDEINEHSKVVIESIFGPATVEQALKGENSEEK